MIKPNKNKSIFPPSAAKIKIRFYSKTSHDKALQAIIPEILEAFKEVDLNTGLKIRAHQEFKKLPRIIVAEVNESTQVQ